MTKKRYYVSVQAGTIMENQGDAAYELEIDANDFELKLLHDLFQQMHTADYHSFWRAHVVAVPYHFDEENDTYDKLLQQVYTLLYQNGTPETQRHIATMNIIDLK
ncbi:UNVERIFIED_CONTAM: hypothetical protein ABID98_002799 [Brevibacillus sp. OAP136]